MNEKSSRPVLRGRDDGNIILLLDRSRTEARLRHSQRARHSSWSFAQLRFFLSYKAALAGVPLHSVDPAYTSRTCSVCAHCAKENRKSQASFRCVNCGHCENADRNAAINISRAEVMRPIVSSGSFSGCSQRSAERQGQATGL
ncbi:MAG: zinc ribbon domain-containing protein [Ktedonobacteraceae bacterium]